MRRFSDLLQPILGSYDQSLENMSLLRNMRQLFLVAVNRRLQNTSLFRDLQTRVWRPRACLVICSSSSVLSGTGVGREREPAH